jgi:hypothetical protein
LAYKNASHNGWICYVNVILVSYGGHNSYYNFFSMGKKIKIKDWFIICHLNIKMKNPFMEIDII